MRTTAAVQAAKALKGVSYTGFLMSSIDETIGKFLLIYIINLLRELLDNEINTKHNDEKTPLH